MKITKTLILTCFLFLGILFSKTTFCQTGATCATALNLTITPGQNTGWQTTTNDTLWYTFTAPNQICNFNLYTKLGSKKYLKNVLYGTCGFTPRGDQLKNINDSTYFLTFYNVTASQNYKIGLIFGYPSGCGTCSNTASYKIEFKEALAIVTCTANCDSTSTCEYLCNGSFEQFGSIPQKDGEFNNACGWAAVLNSLDLFPIFLGNRSKLFKTTIT